MVLIVAVVPGYLSKLLFRKASRSDRRRKMRAVWFWLVAAILIIATVAGIVWLVYLQERR